MTRTGRWCRRLVDGAAWLVPGDSRDDWRREWHAEIAGYTAPARAGGAARRGLVWRVLGAAVHAAWLRWDRWRGSMWTYDLRIAVRSLLRQPAFAAVAVATLAVGIGANAAVFSAVYAVLLRPLPFPAPDRLVALTTTGPRAPQVGMESSPPDFVDWHDGASSFSAMAALSADAVAIAGTTPAEQVPGAAVTGEFFAVIGTTAARGRVLTVEDAREGAAPVVVLGDRLWARRFARAPGILGTHVTIDGVSREVVGVLPPGHAYPLDAELWIPLGFSAERLATQRGAQYLDVVARLGDGQTIERARADVATVAARLAAAHPKTNAGRSVVVRPLREVVVGDIGPSLLMLLAAAGLVLLIVCVNVAGLVLTRALGRAHETALRASLGAAPWRLIRAALTETLVLAIAGAIGGTGLAWIGARRIAALEAVSHVPLLGETRLDGTVLAATALAATVTALAVGLVPSWRTARSVRLAGAQGTTRATARGGVRGLLVAAEVALALVLVVGAVTLARSFVRMVAVPRGFEVSDRILTASLTLPEAQYLTPALRASFVERVLAGVRALPGVESAGAVFGVPLTGFGYSITVRDLDGVRQQDDPQTEKLLALRAVTPDYFTTMRIALEAGRAVGPQDVLGQPRVAVVNRAAAALLWPGADPLGHAVTLGTHLGQDDVRTGGIIVGVVDDTREGAVDRPVRPTLYVPHAQDPTSVVAIVVRGAGRTPDAAAVRAVLAGLDPDVPLFRVRTTEQLASTVVAQPRLLTALMSLFAAAALLVAGIGLYGLLAQAVAARVREIGVRRAVGATARDVAALIAAHTSRMVGLGAVVGIAASWAASSALDRFVFGRHGPDVAAYAAAVAALAGVATLAAAVPCRRALAVDPATTLRSE